MPRLPDKAGFEPIAPDFDIEAFMESSPNMQQTPRMSKKTFDTLVSSNGLANVLKHVIKDGLPLVINGFESSKTAEVYSTTWLHQNIGAQYENARDLNNCKDVRTNVSSYLNDMPRLANQIFEGCDRERVYLKDMDCPQVWCGHINTQLPFAFRYMCGSPRDDTLHRGDLMTMLPEEKRTRNQLCYIGHEGTYTAAHQTVCATMGVNLMLEASHDQRTSSGDDYEELGSSLWFLTSTEDRDKVSRYWISRLGHDVEIEAHFAPPQALQGAPFKVYVLTQQPGDLLLIPPLAPYQVWNRGTRTVKVAWSITTVDTLELALRIALPQMRLVCREEQYKVKTIVYHSLQVYSELLQRAQGCMKGLRVFSSGDMLEDLKHFRNKGASKHLLDDFSRLLQLFLEILLEESFNDMGSTPPIRRLEDAGNITCAFCRCDIFNRFLSCSSCKNEPGYDTDDGHGMAYDVCLDCYTMGRSCIHLSKLDWIQQYGWSELTKSYEDWRDLLDFFTDSDTPVPPSLAEAKAQYGKKTVAEVCQEQLVLRPWRDTSLMSSHDQAETQPGFPPRDAQILAQTCDQAVCHMCGVNHLTWQVAACANCQECWSYDGLYRCFEMSPKSVMEQLDWVCPHCRGCCLRELCIRHYDMESYVPKNILVGQDTRKVADERSVEALIDFSASNRQSCKVPPFFVTSDSQRTIREVEGITADGPGSSPIHDGRSARRRALSEDSDYEASSSKKDSSPDPRQYSSDDVCKDLLLRSDRSRTCELAMDHEHTERALQSAIGSQDGIPDSQISLPNRSKSMESYIEVDERASSFYPVTQVQQPLKRKRGVSFVLPKSASKKTDHDVSPENHIALDRVAWSRSFTTEERASTHEWLDDIFDEAERVGKLIHLEATLGHSVVRAKQAAQADGPLFRPKNSSSAALSTTGTDRHISQQVLPLSHGGASVPGLKALLQPMTGGIRSATDENVLTTNMSITADPVVISDDDDDAPANQTGHPIFQRTDRRLPALGDRSRNTQGLRHKRGPRDNSTWTPPIE